MPNVLLQNVDSFKNTSSKRSKPQCCVFFVANQVFLTAMNIWRTKYDDISQKSLLLLCCDFAVEAMLRYVQT